MPDELDPLLLRWFAQTRQPLIDAQFTAQVIAQLQHTRRRGLARRPQGRGSAAIQYTDRERGSHASENPSTCDNARHRGVARPRVVDVSLEFTVHG